MFDAPEPWGPWSTVLFQKDTSRWGSKVICFTFANKWLSVDGREFVIVHTKNDSWASIEGEFTVAPEKAAAGAAVSAQSGHRGTRMGAGETIIRTAKDGDNWPLTWADDDALYTTWGDGTGFVPKVEKKLSMGFARITGHRTISAATTSAPPPSNSARAARARKAGASCAWMACSISGSGTPTTGRDAQLAWSRDHAKTWTFADWKFAEFGMMGFVNFGKDYAGARDEFVYAYSHDDPRADTPADRFILMRAPKDSSRSARHGSSSSKLDADGQPVWTRDIAAARRGFRKPRRLPALRDDLLRAAARYLWWQHLPQPPGVTNDRGDTRFTGGFAVYDAPEPWGPWTTAFFTERWDVGPGEHGDFPAKWMSADGMTLHLVFSGEDAFPCAQRE